MNKSFYKKVVLCPMFTTVLLVSFLLSPLLFLVQTTEAAPTVLGTLKWRAAAPGGGEGLTIGDVNNDGIQEVIWASSNRCVALKGTDGSTVWNVSVPGSDSTTQPQLADLNKDGYLEVVVPILGPPVGAGFYVLSGRDGSVLQKTTTVKLSSGGSASFGRCDNGPVIAPLDLGDYPTLFFASMSFVEIQDDSNSTGFIVSYKYNSTTKTYVQQNYLRVWHPCSGGLSIADTDHDGELELYMNDRHMYMDRGYGGGVVSLWAGNLTQRWSVPDMLLSSHKPMLADVDGDGILDVIVTPQRGGLAVLNSKDGSVLTTGGIYRKQQTIVTQWGPISGHYQSSVYDVDGDGHLEILMADGSHSITNDTVIWDLYGWKEDARISGNLTGQCYYGPKEGDVTGDGIMDIVIANYSRVFVFDGSHNPTTDHTYPLVWMSQNLTSTLMFPVIQDVDNDGYNEIVVATQAGWVYCFGTPAPTPNPRARTELEFSSERRLGVAQYVPPPFATPEPVIAAPSPADWARLVPITTSQLSFNLTDYQNNALTYQVTTSPNIGGSTGSGKNGRYTVNINGLKYSTTYVWYVNVTDGTYWTNSSYVFSTTAAPITNTPPTQGTPILNSTTGANGTNNNFTAYSPLAADADGNSVTDIYHTYKNGVSTANLLMPFDTANSTDVKDYSGYNNDGKIVYNVTWTPNGVVGGAYNFNGGYITVPDSNTLDGNYQWYEMSAEMWIKFSTDQHTNRVLFKQPSYQIGFEDSPVNTVYAGIWTLQPNYDPSAGGLVSDYIEAKDPIPLSKNVWHQVSFTYKYLQGVSLYVDGVLVASTNNSATDFGYIQRGIQPLYIGRFDYYRGMIDEVSIYPKCLSPQQIHQDYIQSKNGLSSSSTLVSNEITSGDQLRCEVVPNDGYVDGTVQSTRTITVGVPDQYTLTANTVGQGSIVRSPNNATYTYATNVDLTASPSTGWNFAGWSGAVTGMTNPATVNVTGNLSVTASFTQNQQQNSYYLTVLVNGTGSVALNNTGPYSLGDIVRLNTSGAPGWSFDHWNGDLNGSSNPATLVIDNNKTVTATFIPNAYNLNVTIVGPGTVNLNNSGPYSYGDVIQLTAVPSANWSFAGWSGNLSGMANPTTVTITENASVTATFTNTTYLFRDGFETGTYNNWTGTAHSSGETSTVVSTLSHSGTFSAKFTTTGSTGYETAYAYESLSSSAELYARGYFYVGQSGISSNSAYIYFIIFKAGSNALVYAGWKMTGGVIKWSLMTRSGTSYTSSTYSVDTPLLNTWYGVELHWKNDASSGYAELYVDGKLVCSITGKNTSSYGNADTVRFGVAETYNCTSTVVYCDDAVISNIYVGPLSAQSQMNTNALTTTASDSSQTTTINTDRKKTT